MAQKREILATIALPYANGSLHLGHLVEAVQTDIWVRFQKLLGNTCYFISGSDAHGTPIMIKAKELGLSPEELVTKIREEHMKDFSAFAIDFDEFHTTHSPENKILSELFYETLKANGDITEHEIEQAFDPKAQMFLPDRFVKGECPFCHAKDQYGDNCEACGKTYACSELINPVSIISGEKPITKKTEHYFFDLNRYRDLLHTWLKSGKLQEEMVNKLEEWFVAGLKEWDITRDAPYFGFEIPGAPGKYFYVWLDAPIGYLASFKAYCDKHPSVDFDKYWQANAKTELYHFIGKDITYFHALFWPAMLTAAGFRTPTGIHVHGFLTVNGQKMSKSRGTFIKASMYREYLDPTYLRYYFAAKLNNKVEDIDLNFEDFVQRINADLVGKVVNIASRCAGFINKIFDNQLAGSLDNPALYEFFVQQGTKIAASYEDREFGRAVREIMELSDKANQYIDEQKPWALAKQEGQLEKVQLVCTMGINLFKIIMSYLKPIVPTLASDAEKFLNAGSLNFANIDKPLLSHHVLQFHPLLQRIDKEKVLAMLEAAKNTTK